MSELPGPALLECPPARPGSAPIARERRVNTITARVLTGTCVVALALILAGLVTALATGDRTAHNASLGGFAAHGGTGELLLGLGLVALAAAPALGILATVACWLRDGDRRYALTAALVVALLVGGAFLG
ncbi:DUF1634 domain-containing protein [Kitasatospora mediocidica]|uniref:DUF1634 domain-containing protein n=1 Tax=Kitasatospora mediocidica TaxID=58352 RepID=UPI0005694336|nr:DUF1634 domain-containing protein [Kitasatospora mediocidica]